MPIDHSGMKLLINKCENEIYNNELDLLIPSLPPKTKSMPSYNAMDGYHLPLGDAVALVPPNSG